MKKQLITLAILALSFTVKAQTPVIDTAVQGITCVKIVGVRASFQDTVLSTLLGAYVVADNLKNSATFYWATMIPITDTTGKVIGTRQTQYGNYTMTEAQYLAWCHPENCDTWPFACIAQAYGLTFPTVNNTEKKK